MRPPDLQVLAATEAPASDFRRNDEGRGLPRPSEVRLARQCAYAQVPPNVRLDFSRSGPGPGTAATVQAPLLKAIV